VSDELADKVTTVEPIYICHYSVAYYTTGNAIIQQGAPLTTRPHTSPGGVLTTPPRQKPSAISPLPRNPLLYLFKIHSNRSYKSNNMIKEQDLFIFLVIDLAVRETIYALLATNRLLVPPVRLSSVADQPLGFHGRWTPCLEHCRRTHSNISVTLSHC